MMEQTDIRPLIDALIGVMRSNGSLKSAAVEQVFRDVPRHLFLPDEPLERVYQDIAITVKENDEGVWTSASSQPSVMAAQLEQLELQSGMHVLEIGAGTGYNAALMARLVGETGSVVTIDIQPDLIERAREHLSRAGVLPLLTEPGQVRNGFALVQAIAADGGEGYPPGAPYDRIILTVSSWVITPAWREQLKDGGRLVLPLHLNGDQKSIAFERRGEELVSLSVWDCGFMPLQGAFAVPPPSQIHTGPGGRLVLDSLQPLPVDEQTFSRWLSGRRETYPTGFNMTLREILVYFYTWLAVRSPDGFPTFSAAGEAVEAVIPIALIAVKGQEKWVRTLLKVLPDGAAVITRPPDAVIDWIDPEQSEEEREPEQPFEVYIQQLGPGPEAAQFLVRMLQAWDAAGRPNSSKMHLRGIPAGNPQQTPGQMQEGECLIERPWTNFVVWYQD